MTQEQKDKATPVSPEPNAGYRVEKREWTRWWKVLDPQGELVCLTVYRRGAREVARRLNEAERSR